MTKIRKPCSNCPWRLDAKPGYWHPDHFTSIWQRCQDDGLAMMLCHKSTVGVTELPCQGWARVVQFEAIGVRVAVLQGKLTLEEVSDTDTVELYKSFEDMLRANGVEPGPRNRVLDDRGES